MPPSSEVIRPALALALTLAACEQPGPPPAPPDILLVVLDTVRADRMSAYGYERPTGSQLEAIAAAGVLFEDVTAPSSWTWTSHASLFTGLSPWEHGAHWTSDERYALRAAGQQSEWQLTPLGLELPTLASRLGEAGYRTASVSGNVLLHPSLGLTRGFERAECKERDSQVVAAALDVMAQQDARPLFLFVNLMSGHAPYLLAPGVPWSAAHEQALLPEQAPDWARPYLLSAPRGPGISMATDPDGDGYSGEKEYAQQRLRIPPAGRQLISDLYDGDLLRLDHALRALVQGWNGSGRAAGVVAVTADHGEYLGEHGQLGHGQTLYGEVLQVPLVVAAPGRLQAGQRVSAPVAMQQLHATLLDLAGLEAGVSLLDVAAGGCGPRFIEAGVWATDPSLGAVGQAYRLVREGDRALLLRDDGAAALYDLRADPGMTTDLSQAEPDRAQALTERAQRAFLAQPASMGAPLQADEQTLMALEALGYVD